jgi:GNAT superfamily N-acetyltransferase
MYKPTKQRQQEEVIMNRLLKKAEWFNIQSKVGEFQGHCFHPAELSEEEKQTLFEYVYFVGLSAFIQNPSEEMEQDIYKHLFNEDRLYIVLNKTIPWGASEVGGARVIAFLSTRDLPTEKGSMLYVSGICVDPALQGYGIGKALMNEAFKRGSYKVASLRTQNPVMKQSFDQTIGGSSFPNGVRPPKEVLDIAQGLSLALKTQNYDYERMVCNGVYGSCLYGVEPSSRNDYYDAKFCEINKQKGDSILCVKIL